MIDSASIDFWFDFASPYGYFMSERIDAVAARHGRRVQWRPIILFAALKALDLPAPLTSPIKRAYLTHDFGRSARFFGLPYRLPAVFPVSTHAAARAFYLVDRVDPVAAVRFAQETLRRQFVDGAAITDPAELAACMSRNAPSIGDAAAAAELLKSDAAKALLAKAVDHAVEHKVFGSPFVVIDGEPFFGADRLPQIEAWLAGPLALMTAATLPD